jgi:hypothetical protein
VKVKERFMLAPLALVVGNPHASRCEIDKFSERGREASPTGDRSRIAGAGTGRRRSLQTTQSPFARILPSVFSLVYPILELLGSLVTKVTSHAASSHQCSLHNMMRYMMRWVYSPSDTVVFPCLARLCWSKTGTRALSRMLGYTCSFCLGRRSLFTYRCSRKRTLVTKNWQVTDTGS